MFKSYFLTALRNLYRDKYYAGINVVGLSVAIACCLVLGLYVEHETTYDRHNVNHDRLYRVVNLLNTNGFIEDFSQTPVLLGPLLQRDYTQVQDFVRFQELSTTLIRNEDVALYQDAVVFADPNVFELFTHRILAGDPVTALIDPLAIAVSESFALTYFGTADALGQTLSTDTTTYQVTLVFADLPRNSHLQYDALLSLNRLAPASISDLASPSAQDSLGNTNTFTYLLLPPDYVQADFQALSTEFWQRYMAPNFEETTYHEYYLEPLTSIHLHSTTLADFPRGSAYFVYALAAIGVFLLLVASINYMNLATARATRRAREVAMRKLLGSSRAQLIYQFLSESLLFVALAIPLALVLAEAATSFTQINALLGMTINTEQLLAPATLTVLITMTFLLGLLSGLYPAFHLSSMRAISVSALSHESKARLSLTRHGLVLVQFAISISVVACTLLMYSQMEYFYNRSLGFEKTNKLVLRLRSADIPEQLSAVRDRLGQNSNVDGVTTSNAIPGGGFTITAGEVESDNGVMEERVFNAYRIGEDYFEVMGMTIIAGRAFNSAMPTDVNGAVIVNETAVSAMGWAEPVGKRIQGLPVIGVVGDFNFHGLDRELEPLFLMYDPLADRSNYLTISYSGSDESALVDYVESVWEQFDPGHPFEYQFLDDSLNGLYDTERRNMALVGIFATVCILISCLGLAGLTAFTTEQRSKEIGIRKILGATPVQLVMLLFRNICIVVLIASAIASLFSFIVMQRWLQGFAYHVDINNFAFVLATGFCVLIAFVTMALQTWRVSTSNPVSALRYE